MPPPCSAPAFPELSEGTKLSFDVQPDQRGRGPQAVDLQLT
jgi:cold shock protein